MSMKTKNFPIVSVVLIVTICICFLYAVHKDLSPSVQGSVGSLELKVSADSKQNEQSGEKSLP